MEKISYRAQRIKSNGKTKKVIEHPTFYEKLEKEMTHLVRRSLSFPPFSCKFFLTALKELNPMGIPKK